MSISLDSIFTILNKTIDILLVWLIFYYIMKVIKDNVKLTLIFKGILILIILDNNFLRVECSNEQGEMLPPQDIFANIEKALSKYM